MASKTADGWTRGHRKSKSIDSTFYVHLNIPGPDNVPMQPIQRKSTGISAIWTPPRSKAKASKKEKKKSKKTKESHESSQLEVEWKHLRDVRRCRSVSPTGESSICPLAVKKKPLKVSLSCEATSTRRVNERERSPHASTDSNYKSDHPVADVRLRPPKNEPKDEHDGPTSNNRDNRKSFFDELQRSHSLDNMISDEYEFHRTKIQERPQDLETLLPSRNAVYQRCISTQVQTKLSQRRKQELPPKSYHGPWDRRRLIQPEQDESPELRRRGGILVAQCMSHRVVQQSRNAEDLLHLTEAKIDVNILDEVTGDALIHVIMKKKRKLERLEFLLTLLIHAQVNVNLQNKKGVAALHIAVEEGDYMCVKALVVFGADVNMEGRNHFTPMDLAINNGTVPEIEELLINLQAKGSAQLIERIDSTVLNCYLYTKKRRLPRRILNTRSTTSDRIADFVNRKNMMKLCRELETNINQRLSFSASIGGNDDTMVLVMQQREVALFNKTLRQSALYSTVLEMEEGSRVLCLDGGGVKGLIQIEVLMQIEAKMKRKITELFDWIVGTSTGGVIALALVYGGKSLSELRQLYFRIKDEIFAKGRYGFGWDSDAYEAILQEYLDPNIMLTDVKYPRVLIAAVNKATTNLELNFFNNCLDDQFCDYQVWKVARYTSAAPMFLRECDNYVDGGVICNNPTDCGLTVIQNFYRKQEMKPPIALVVSVGSGIFPAEKIGKVDAQAFLYFGKQWLQVSKLMKRTQNLLTLLSQALVETEKVTENSKSRCKEQGIPFYRFNPTLNDIIPAGETDNTKLLDMVIETKVQIKEQSLKEMTEILQMITISSYDIPPTPTPVQSATSNASTQEAESSAEKERHDPSEQIQAAEVPQTISEKRQVFQVPQVSITNEDDEPLQEDDGSQLNDQHNDMLNESLIHPTDSVMDDHATASPDDFTASDNTKELSNGQLPHSHYQLEVDGQEQQPDASHQQRDSYLLETTEQL